MTTLECPSVSELRSQTRKTEVLTLNPIMLVSSRIRSMEGIIVELKAKSESLAVWRSHWVALSWDQVPLLLLNNRLIENNSAWSDKASWHGAQANSVHDTSWQTCTRWQMDDEAVIPAALAKKWLKVIHLFKKDLAFTRQLMWYNTCSLICTSSWFHVSILVQC